MIDYQDLDYILGSNFLIDQQINQSIDQLNDNIRLGIEFDEYHGESMYSREKSESIIQLLNKQNILQVGQFYF